MSRSNSPKRRHPNRELPPHPMGRCPTGKYRWGDRAAAKRHMKRLEGKGRDASSRPLNIYRCRECSGYHVGHKPWDKAHPEGPESLTTL